jgi:hypothetical protein
VVGAGGATVVVVVVVVVGLTADGDEETAVTTRVTTDVLVSVASPPESEHPVMTVAAAVAMKAARVQRVRIIVYLSVHFGLEGGEPRVRAFTNETNAHKSSIGVPGGAGMNGLVHRTVPIATCLPVKR